MKRGFTMIELIFVIVILGILAAVAIPRLAATRDDAVLASVKADVTTASNSVPAWYQGQKDARIIEAVQLDTTRWERQGSNENFTWNDGVADCVTIAVWDQNGTAGPGTLAVADTDYDSATGEWLAAAEYQPVLRIIKGTSAAAYTDGTSDLCDTIWTDMGLTESNITMAGNRVKW